MHHPGDSEAEDLPPASSASTAPPTANPRGMRMAELARRSGVTRETIHFYLREGLLPRPEKGGRTVAYYGEEHIDRLRTIRRLREEKYLPLAVIRRLLESPATTAERDVGLLADVLHLIAPGEDAGREFAPETLAEASARRLLGPNTAIGAGGARPAVRDPAELRVLRVIDDALGLEGTARRLTLDDLEACATSLTALVGAEAALVFDAMFESGDVGGAIAALRTGRPAVARFITAYRDLMLRRVVEEVLVGLEQGPEVVLRAATVPLSPAREAQLGVPERRAALWDAWRRAGDEPSAAQLLWHLFGTGASAELGSLLPELVAHAGARLAPLCAWGALESARSATTLAALDRAVAAAPDLALGQILLGEAVVARGLRRRHGGASLLEQAIPAVHRVFAADPERDPEPCARAFGWFHRGRLELQLPAVLGRKERALLSLEKALAVIGASGDAIEPAVRARIGANARLALGRHWMGAGDEARARALLDEAAAVDPDGPIGRAARGESAASA
jgi:DNA-binding transcriptional MerR regulator/tetratricopeptide (TPR) repeat protein